MTTLRTRWIPVFPAILTMMLMPGLLLAQAPQTRLLVSEIRIKPDRIDEWIEIQESEVVPALKQAGLMERDVFRGVIGETTTFVVVRPLPGFGEYDGDGILVDALGLEAAGALAARLRDCVLAEETRIENRRDDFTLDPGDAEALFYSRYRAQPGQSAAYMNFIRDEMFPVMREAQDDGTFAGLTVTVSAQGGEAGLITLNMFYDNFEPLDGPPPIAKTLGPAGTAEFLRKGAGLITGIEQLIYRRIAALSF